MTQQRNKREIPKNSSPISYSNVGIADMVTLLKRSALLDERIVEGYGCIWGKKNIHGEIFVRGCFAKSIRENGPTSNANYQIKFRDEHGRACALFEVLREDEVGLYFRTKPLDNVQWANDLLVQLRSGTINNFSNGFKYIWDKVEYDEATDSLMMVEARLFEISAVAIPSDLETFAVRSIEEPEYLEEATEDFILSLPKSKRLECRKIIARHISLIQQTEPAHVHTKPLEKRTKPKVVNKNKGIDYQFLINSLKKE